MEFEVTKIGARNEFEALKKYNALVKIIENICTEVVTEKILMGISQEEFEKIQTSKWFSEDMLNKFKIEEAVDGLLAKEDLTTIKNLFVEDKIILKSENFDSTLDDTQKYLKYHIENCTLKPILVKKIISEMKGKFDNEFLIDKSF